MTKHAFAEEGLLIGVTGDTIALSPLIVSDEIGEIFDKVARVIKAVS